jgi:tight adherence protein B
MVDPSILFSAILLVVCLAAFIARRSALRRERAGSLLSEDFPSSDSTSLSLLREGLRGRPAKPLSRRARFFLNAAIGLAVFIYTRNPIIAVLPWLVTAGAQRLLDAHRRRKSNKRKEEQVLELIDSLNQSLRSGLSLQQSLEVSLEDVGEEMRSEMFSVLKDLGLGSGLEEALSKAAGLSPNPSLKLTFTVLGLLHGKGGDLPRILERLRKRVAEGLEVRREARILTSQSRASGYLVSCLPPVFLGLQAILNPNSLRPLLSTSMGNLMVAVAAGLNIAAFFLIRRIVSPGG